MPVQPVRKKPNALNARYLFLPIFASSRNFTDKIYADRSIDDRACQAKNRLKSESRQSIFYRKLLAEAAILIS